MMASVVDAALAALPPPPGAVEVIGRGRLATALRTHLQSRCAVPGQRAIAVIETTGDPRAIQDALRRVADLGTVVLAGPATGEPVALDLYADLHVRGLTLIGTSSAPEDAP